MASINDNRLTYHSALEKPVILIITSFISLALYNVIELSFIILSTFKTRSGLYFWSMIVANIGVALNAIGYVLKYHQPSSSNRYVFVALIGIGWSCMVTGQSFVLFSRLHLLLRNQRTIRLVLAMIVINALICHPPIIVILFSTYSKDPGVFFRPYGVYERAQLCIFFTQELVISSVYVFEAYKLRRMRSAISKSRGAWTGREFMLWLIFINIVVVLLDVSFLALEFFGWYELQTSCKALVYSVKLKMEISILNKMVDMIKARKPTIFGTYGLNISGFNGSTQLGLDSTINPQPKMPVYQQRGQRHVTDQDEERPFTHGFRVNIPARRQVVKDCNSMYGWASRYTTRTA